MGRKLRINLFTIILLITVSCNPKPDPEPIPTSISEKTSYHYLVETDDSPDIVVSGKEFQITTNNCGSRVSAQESFTRSREFNVTLNTQFSETVRGLIGGDILIAGAEIGAEIGVELGIQVSSKEIIQSSRVIETPADSITTVSLQWEEIWQTGNIVILRADETKLGDVPFRILTTMRLTQTGIQDSPCGTITPLLPQSSSTASTPTLLDPTPYPTSTAYPTFTPYPTYTYFPTQKAESTTVSVTNTPNLVLPPPPTPIQQNTGLSIGQWYTQGNISIGLTEISYRDGSKLYIGLTVPVRNVSSNSIAFEYGSYNFLVRDNLGNTYPARGDQTKTVTLGPGETERFLTPGLCCAIFFDVNYADANITQLIFQVSNLTGVSADWIIPISH